MSTQPASNNKGQQQLKKQAFSYSQAIVALGLIAFGAFLLMTGTAVIAVVVSTVALMLFFAHFLFGRKPERLEDKNQQTNGKTAYWSK